MLLLVNKVKYCYIEGVVFVSWIEVLFCVVLFSLYLVLGMMEKEEKVQCRVLMNEYGISELGVVKWVVWQMDELWGIFCQGREL